MQQMGDDDSNTQQMALAKKINLREKNSTYISSFVPNLHLQLSLNHLAGTSMQQHMDYLNETELFHERLRLFFYPKVFEELRADSIDWTEIHPVFYKAEITTNPLNSCFPLIFAILFFGTITIPVASKL